MRCGCQLRAQPDSVYSGQFVHSKQTQTVFLSISNDPLPPFSHSYIPSHTHWGAVVKYLWPGEAAVLLYLISLRAFSIPLALAASQLPLSHNKTLQVKAQVCSWSLNQKFVLSSCSVLQTVNESVFLLTSEQRRQEDAEVRPAAPWRCITPSF